MLKFKYVGKLPRNVSYNGISFPVTQGCIIEAPEGYLETFLPPHQIRKVSQSELAKFSFPKARGPFRPDPMGGLPMKSVEGKPKNAPPDMAPSPATVEIVNPEFTNPYHLPNPEDDEDYGRTAEVSTNPAVQTKNDPKPEPPASDEAKEAATETVELTEDPEDIGQDDVETTEAPDTGPAVDAPTKTELRKCNKADLIEMAGSIVESGAPLNPEMLAELGEINDDMHRGPMFETILKYYGME